MRFDMEITARLQGKRDALKAELAEAISAILDYDTWDSIMNLVVESRVQAAFDRMGLIVDYDKVVWYEFLRTQGVTLPDIVTSFVEMTSSTWMLFPTRDSVYAVEHPISQKTGPNGHKQIIFSNDDVLFFKKRS